MMRSILFSTSLALLSTLFLACGAASTSDTEDPIEEETTSTVISLTPQVDAVTGYIDPACKMKVAPDASITHTHEGVTYGFCGEGCKAAFVADPAPYLAALEE